MLSMTLYGKQTAKIVGKQGIFVEELREHNLGKYCKKSIEWLKTNMESHEKLLMIKYFPILKAETIC